MSNGIRSKSKFPDDVKDLSYLKPRKFRHYLTLAELCAWLDRQGEKRHKTSIMKLEAEGKIPMAARAQCGQLEIRLWSPVQAEEILRLLKTTIHPGRPAGRSNRRRRRRR